MYQTDHAYKYYMVSKVTCCAFVLDENIVNKYRTVVYMHGIIITLLLIGISIAWTRSS